MPIRVGLVGLGFMGKCHYETYGRLKGVQVAGICDVDRRKLSGDWSKIAGNIGGAGGKVDLSGLKLTDRLGDLLSDPQIDLIDITLPTYLHAEAALAALKAGKHVVCEKPLARTAAEAGKLVAAAAKAKGQLFVAHCIRFWPAYAAAKKLVQSGKYGKVRSAWFRRHSCLPTWSWQNWLQDPKKSGACALDLHIHDADFILYCFGKPQAVTSQAYGFTKGRADHIVTSYDYGKGALITAEGAWEYPKTYPFSMTFSIAMEKATLRFDGQLELHTASGKKSAVKIPASDGYTEELAHFVDCLRRGRKSDVVSPESAYQSVKLVEAELASAAAGKTVKVKF